MQEKILDYLRRSDLFVSGEEMSDGLGISRQALWKHIQELKKNGYEITAVPHQGYRLDSCPDRLFASEVSRGLATQFVGKKIYYYDEIASTMEAATQLGLKGALEGTLVLAETQAKGRGRLGRDWFSPKYKGIYLSLLLRPKITPAEAPVFTILAAVSICEAVKESCGITPQIKWPNDILIHNKKAAGILTEVNADNDAVRFMVIGIGLNVNNQGKSLPQQATSLWEEKKELVSRLGLLQEMLRAIEANYLLLSKSGSPPIIEKWRQYNLTLGRRVRISILNGSVEGEAVDIDPEGRLLLRTDAGLVKNISAGDIVHCR